MTEGDRQEPEEAEPTMSKLDRATGALRSYATELNSDEQAPGWILRNAEALARLVLEA